MIKDLYDLNTHCDITVEELADDICDDISNVLDDAICTDLEKAIKDVMLQASDNGHKVPILSITMDLEKYNKDHKGSCDFCVIPDLQEDEHIKNTLFELVDYIRENYNCNKFIEP